MLQEERKEWKRLHADTAALGRLEEIRNFRVTPEIRSAYVQLIAQYEASARSDKVKYQQDELVDIAMQEQLKVLQPLIYDDLELKATMDANHAMSRRFGSWLAPPFKVVYSAQAATDGPNPQTVFAEPTGLWDRIRGSGKSLPDPDDRMRFVRRIASDFNRLMGEQSHYRPGLIRALQTIRGGLNA